MALRRITKSAIDWAALAERVPEAQKSMYYAFKSTSDGYLRKVTSLPEDPPKIDWTFYKSKISMPGLVENFEKQYAALKVAYPADKVSVEIDKQERETEQEVIEFVKQSVTRIAEHKKELEKWDNIIPFEHMTMEDFRDAFPDLAIDMINRPTFWPHDAESQKLPEIKHEH